MSVHDIGRIVASIVLFFIFSIFIMPAQYAIWAPIVAAVFSEMVWSLIKGGISLDNIFDFNNLGFYGFVVHSIFYSPAVLWRITLSGLVVLVTVFLWRYRIPRPAREGEIIKDIFIKKWGPSMYDYLDRRYYQDGGKL